MAAFQFILHRRCSWACAPDPAERHGKPHCAAPCGGCMLVYPGIFCGENMQIEGFRYDLFSGAFEAAAIHCAASKILRPLLFGRGWCDWACRTAMVLDSLPLEGPNEPQKTLFRLAPVCCICRLPHLCHRLFDAHELFCPSPREVPQNKVHRLREVPSGLPDGCGRYGQHPEAGKSCVLPAPEPARTTHCEGKTESSQMKILPECQSRPLYMLISL